MDQPRQRILFETGMAVLELLRGGIPANLNPDSYEEDDERQYAEVINRLIQCVAEIRDFAIPLSKGELRKQLPRTQNLIAGPLKELHARLSHLTWQAQQIADGDYSQRVDFMGDFSTAFNRMVITLDERERALKEKLELLAAKTNELGAANMELRKEIELRKQAQESLRQAKEEVEESYRKLEIKTEEAERMAIEARIANRAKSDFLASMSHEIRTPMSGIIGLTSLALQTDLTDEQKEYLEAVKSSGDILLKLINDILDLSKIEAGKLEFEHVDFDLRKQLDTPIRIMKSQARAKGLELEAFFDPELPLFFRGDSGRVRQVLINLIGNAVKFTETGGVYVNVQRISSEPASGTRPARHQLLFAVKDTGIGIPTDQQDQVFEKFRRVTGQEGGKREGTGLGLAISRSLVEQMGGRIQLRSRPGEGSVFSFTLTLEQGNPPESADQETSRSVPSPGASLRVLVAEDEPLNARVAEGVLDPWTRELLVVSNGWEAVQALRNGDFDLVFMDVEMPRMGGIEAVHRIREGEAGEKCRNIPIVAMTAHALTGDRERFLQSGMDDYISKPLDLHDLAAILNRFTDGKAAMPDDPSEEVHPSGRVLDRRRALLRLDGSEEIFQELLDLFSTELPNLISEFKAASDAADIKSLERHAHSLRSSTGAIGADSCSAIAAQIETHAREGSLDDVHSLLPKLFEELEKVRALLSGST